MVSLDFPLPSVFWSTKCACNTKVSVVGQRVDRLYARGGFPAGDKLTYFSTSQVTYTT